jgi:hypothetical protein
MPSYTYSGDPGTTPKDMVRFLVRDTGSEANTDPTQAAGWLMSDEEIIWMNGQHSNGYMAAAMCAEHIAALFGSRARKTIGPLTIDYATQEKSYKDLAASLRRNANSVSGPGDLPLSTQTNNNHLFAIGMNDNPEGWGAPPYYTPDPWSGSRA